MATVFEVSGPMAMFRKPYTTTSSVSYAFPPPTAIAGLICAIVGISHSNLEKREGYRALYWEKLSGTRVSIAIKNPLSWLWQTINFSNLKEPQKNLHIQVKHQFVANPRYRIYVAEGLEESLLHFLKQGSFIYTPYLGVAYGLANIEFIGCFDEIPLKDETGLNRPIAVDTVVPGIEGVKLDVIQSGGAYKEVVPFRMDESRQLLETISVFYQVSTNKKIVLKEQGDLHVSRCGDDQVAWFPQW